jgi:hypothetical protein
VVTANDEVGCAKVLADDGVPKSLSGSSHAHGKGEESEVGHTLRVRRHEGLVSPNTGEVVDVSGLGETDDGVDEDVGATLTSRSDRELTVSAVHGVTSLESDDLPPCDLVEVRAELGGGVSERDVVVVRRSLDRLDLAADVKLLGLLVEVRDSGVSAVVSAHDLGSLEGLVGSVNVVHGEDGEGSFVTGVTEGEAGSGPDVEDLNVLGGNVEGDWHGEEGALALAVDLGKAEGITHAAT